MPTNTFNLLAICGSLRPNSSNHSIIQFIAANTPDNVALTQFEGIDRLPHFNPALDVDDAPIPVAQMREAIHKADGVIVCTPEYAFGVPGSLKNVLDWTVSSGSFNQKTVSIITASSNGSKAHAALLQIFTALGASFTEDTTLLIPFIRTKVSSGGEITHEATKHALYGVLHTLLTTIYSTKVE